MTHVELMLLLISLAQKHEHSPDTPCSVAPFLGPGEADDGERLEAAVGLLGERASTLVELADGARCFLTEGLEWDRNAVGKFLDEEGLKRIGVLVEQLELQEDWSERAIEAAFAAAMAGLGVNLGKLAQPARVALTGSKASPGIYEVCAVLGRQRTLARLRRVITDLQDGDLPLTPVAG